MPARIVVVHDEPSLLEPLAASLKADGHEVAAFDDPGAALRWISPGMSVEVRIVFGSHPRWLDFLD